MGKFRNVFKKFLGFEEVAEMDYDFETVLSQRKQEEQNIEYEQSKVGSQNIDQFKFDEPTQVRERRPDRRESFAEIYNEFEQPQTKRRNEMMIKPRDFSDACTVVERIAEGNVVIMDLEQLDMETCKRISDFVLGAVFVMQGDVEKISARVFRFWVEEE